MGNIVNDIVEDIEIKPNKTKKVLKWVVSGAVSLIGIAFVLGQFKASFFNRMDLLETSLVEIRTEQTTGFNKVNTRIDKVYEDGLLLFNKFQENNNQQLELMIDYGGSNKDMLKRMLEINTLNLESSVEKAKTENVTPVVQEVDIPVQHDYMSEVHFIEMETQDTIFGLSGATKKYISSINRNRYEVGTITDSPNYVGRFDVSYRKKR